MAGSVTFYYLGPPEQKHVAKLGPMATLRSALADAAAKWRPPVDAATASVTLNKKPVDLDTAFRLLNIPSGSRLDVVRGALQGAVLRKGCCMLALRVHAGQLTCGAVRCCGAPSAPLNWAAGRREVCQRHRWAASFCSSHAACNQICAVRRRSATASGRSCCEASSSTSSAACNRSRTKPGTGCAATAGEHCPARSAPFSSTGPSGSSGSRPPSRAKLSRVRWQGGRYLQRRCRGSCGPCACGHRSDGAHCRVQPACRGGGCGGSQVG